MKNAYLGHFIRGIFLLAVFLLVMVTGVSVDINKWLEKDFALNGIENLMLPFAKVHLGCRTGSILFAQNNLALSGGANILGEKTYGKSFHEELMATTIQALAYTSDFSKNEEQDKLKNDLETPVIKREKTKTKERDIVKYDFSSECKAVLYCTHTAESYVPSSGKARCEGERGLVDEVARTLAFELERRGLRTEYIDTIHDFPDYSKSYANSRETVKRVLNTEDKILALFDIHRDSIPGLPQGETVEIGGKKSARILIIVGTDERKPHPNWRKNLIFAQNIYNEGERMYPGLIKGVRTKAGTYNQEFHEKALLLEFGSDYNTLEEVLYAADLFADVLINILKKEV
ncbi:stage II sporulation protein P [Thermosyntropha sp.]|uniref:stage II sporulation protein P n=1 Tax=Thermosyntropha sp. TaxID=2740820 RepID=UPI0025FFF537|nr:stage II sporulation protein P [Thermosyntropha sp.]MBO8159161.1 stage II sporulation protein P [Thermosyntropha sp.]